MRPRDWITEHLKGVQWLSNGEVLAYCPLHKNTTSPALSMNYLKGVYICHGCQATGTMFDLAETMGVPLIPTKELSDVTANAAAVRARMERDEGIEKVSIKSNRWLRQFTRTLHPYWDGERMIPRDVQRDWQLGFDEARNSVTIPLRTVKGEIIGVARRSLDPDPAFRWRYPVGFRNKLHLFAADRVANVTPYDLVMVEGSIDCIRVWMAGFPCVALLGSHFSSHQQTLVHQVGEGIQRIHVWMDNDKQGKVAQEQVENRLQQDGYEVFRVPYPRTTPRNLDQSTKTPKDPGDMTLGQLQRCMGRSTSIRRLRARRVSRML